VDNEEKHLSNEHEVLAQEFYEAVNSDAHRAHMEKLRLQNEAELQLIEENGFEHDDDPMSVGGENFNVYRLWPALVQERLAHNALKARVAGIIENHRTRIEKLEQEIRIAEYPRHRTEGF
jgi:hypothetical protein